ncbi:MAG: hypothetical protein ACXWLG_02690 [Myxococcaceae bacterium]
MRPRPVMWVEDETSCTSVGRVGGGEAQLTETEVTLAPDTVPEPFETEQVCPPPLAEGARQ